MRAAILGLATTLIATAAGAQDLSVAANVAGCPAPDETRVDTWVGTNASLETAPVGLKGGWVYASLTSAADGRTAALCVALLERTADGYVRLASGTADVEASTSPSRFSPVIETEGYALAPGVTALGLSAHATLNTTSISAASVDLFLFKQNGDRLVPIFGGLIGEGHYDKVRERHYGRVDCELAVKDRATRGMRDLVLTCKRRRTTYRWTGEHYEAAR